MISATGKINGKEIEVVITDKRNILFNDKEDLILEDDFKQGLDSGYHRGMYYPERDSVLNYINVLENHFFDLPVVAKTDEEVEEMPFEEGVVY